MEGEDHRLSFVNDAFCQLLGRTKGEMIGLPFAEVVPGGEDCVPILDRVYETGDAKAYAQADASDSAGVYWLFAMWPELDAGERPVGVIVQLTRMRKAHHDAVAIHEALLVAGLQQHALREEAEALNTQLHAEIAQRQKVEVALTETLKELQRSQWLGERARLAKDNFLAALSHELRTPLTPVMLMASALAEDPSVPPEARVQLRMMRRNIEIEARLIDDLLDITRITKGKLRMSVDVADLHEIIRFTEGIIRHEPFAPTVKMVFALEATHHHAVVDATRMQQVLWNLMRNAVKFTPAAGTITISTRNSSAGQILIAVEDTGIGISSESLPVVFNAFEQGKVAGQRYGGLGLGLFIAQTIIREHEGTIMAESEGEGCGSKFTITLPCLGAPDAIPHPPVVPAAGARRALRLLVVEDHDATRTVLAQLLTRRGHQVRAEGTMLEALAAFEGEDFDAVISDLGLPDGSGVELMQELHRIRKVPAIALSGYGMTEDIQRTREAGFFAHLVKPVDLEALLQLLDRIEVSGDRSRL